MSTFKLRGLTFKMRVLCKFNLFGNRLLAVTTGCFTKLSLNLKLNNSFTVKNVNIN